MKKALLLVAMMAISIGASAQLSLKPMVGANISSFKGVKKDKGKFGFAAGGELEYRISQYCGVSLGAIYSQQGSRYPIYKNTTDNATVKLEYLNIPVLFNNHFYGGWNLQIGLQVGILTKAKLGEDYTINGGHHEYINGGKELIAGDLNIKNLCNSTDWAIPVNISYEFNNGFLVTLRTCTSLNAVFKGNAPGRNKYVMLGVGYKFDL